MDAQQVIADVSGPPHIEEKGRIALEEGIGSRKMQLRTGSRDGKQPRKDGK